MDAELPETRGYGRLAILVNAAVSLLVTAVVVYWAAGFAVFHEALFRVRPTVERGGIGTNWVAGNAAPVLNGLIAFVHLADVVMGAFILVMVFVHWGAFRRLAAQMRTSEAVGDGGRVADDDTGDGRAPDGGGERP